MSYLIVAILFTICINNIFPILDNASLLIQNFLALCNAKIMKEISNYQEEEPCSTNVIGFHMDDEEEYIEEEEEE